MQPETLLHVALAIVSISILITFGRLIKGPTLPDRVVAVDLMGVSAVGMMVLGAATTGQREFLDAAIVIALLGFFGTVAYSRYVVKESGQ